jgi:hypothetical protein
VRVVLILLVFDGIPNSTKIYPLAIRVSFALEKKDPPSFPLKELIGSLIKPCMYVDPCNFDHTIGIGMQRFHYVSTVPYHDWGNRQRKYESNSESAIIMPHVCCHHLPGINCSLQLRLVIKPSNAKTCHRSGYEAQI